MIVAAPSAPFLPRGPALKKDKFIYKIVQKKLNGLMLTRASHTEPDFS